MKMLKTNGTEKIKKITILMENGLLVEYHNVYRRVERDSVEIADKSDFMYYMYFLYEEIKRVTEKK